MVGWIPHLISLLIIWICGSFLKIVHGRCKVARDAGTCSNISVAGTSVDISFKPNFCNSPVDVTFIVQAQLWRWQSSFSNRDEERRVRGPRLYTVLHVQIYRDDNTSLTVWAQLLVDGGGRSHLLNHTFPVPKTSTLDCSQSGGSVWKRYLPLISLLLIVLAAAAILTKLYLRKSKLKKETPLFPANDDNSGNKNRRPTALGKKRKKLLLKKQSDRKSMLSAHCDLPYLDDAFDDEGSLHTNSTRNSYLISPSTSFLGSVDYANWFQDQAQSESTISRDVNATIEPQGDQTNIELLSPIRDQPSQPSAASQPRYQLTPSQLRSFRGEKRGRKHGAGTKGKHTYVPVSIEGSPSPTPEEQAVHKKKRKEAKSGRSKQNHAALTSNQEVDEEYV